MNIADFSGVIFRAQTLLIPQYMYIYIYAMYTYVCILYIHTYILCKHIWVNQEKRLSKRFSASAFISLFV